MASPATFDPGDHITPGRELYGFIDTAVVSIEQPPLWEEFSGFFMANFLLSSMKWDGTAYRLQSAVDIYSDSYETGALGALIFGAASGQWAGNIQRANLQRWNSNLPGNPQGSQTATGSPMSFMQVPAGQNYGEPTGNLGQLATDVSTFQQPAFNPTPPDPVDRIFASSEDFYPDEAVYERFYMNGKGGGDTLGLINIIYFTGIPTYMAGDSFPGSGKYCLAFCGDGNAYLYECDTNGTLSANWHLRQTVYWCATPFITGHWHFVRISSDAVQDFMGFWHGTQITFEFDIANTIPDSDLGLYDAKTANPYIRYYSTTQVQPVQPHPDKVRIDIRRDADVKFTASQDGYPNPGVLFIRPCPVNFGPDGSVPLRIEVYGQFPPSSSLSATVVAVERIASTSAPTQVTLAPLGAPFQGRYSFSQYFTIPANTFVYGQTTLAIVVIANPTSDTKRTPRIKSCRAIMEATYASADIGTTNIVNIKHASINKQTWDPSAENFGVLCDDPGGLMPQLLFRSGMGIQLNSTCGPSDPVIGTTGTYSILAGGLVAKALASRGDMGDVDSFAEGIDAPAYPPSPWYSYAIAAFGMFASLATKRMPLTYNFALDPSRAESSNGNVVYPYAVDDALRLLFAFAGYGTSQIIVESIPIQLFAAKPEDLNLELFTDIGKIMMQWAVTYAGAYVIFDWNATNVLDGGQPDDIFGAWRVKLPPKPPYNNLAHFVTSPPWSDSQMRSIVSQSGYAAMSAPGQPPYVPIFATEDNPLHAYVIPPEFNDLYVTGVGVGPGLTAVVTGAPANTASAPAGKECRFNYHVINPVSFRESASQVTAPDPNSPDYLGYRKAQYYGDPGLSTDPATAFAARRMYDMAGHAQGWVGPFEAPAVFVVDPFDIYQIRPRLLQFGDPVTIDGEQFFIFSVNPEIDFEKGGAGNMTASYTVFTAPVLNGSYAVAGPQFPTLQTF